MPIWGITASAMSGHLSSFEPIQTVTVGSGGSSTLDFSSIASTYQHLQIRLIARVSNADTGDNIFLQFNGDTGSNYSWHYLEGDGSTANAGGASSQTKILNGRASAANATSGIFGVSVIDILDYSTSGQKYKTVRCLTGLDRNGSGNVRMDSGLWQNTNAITSIKILNGSSTNFVQYTQAALYGVKA